MIIGLGDSHVHGDSFVARAARMFGVPFFDEGVTGRRIAAVPVIDVVPGATVVLMAGNNDVPNAPWDLVKFGNSYEYLIDQLGPVNLICCTILPWRDNHDAHVIRAMNDLLAEIVGRHPTASLFDAHRALVRPDGIVGNVADFRDDGCHLSDRGKQWLAQLLYLHLKRETCVNRVRRGAGD